MAFAKQIRYETRILNQSFGDGVNTFLSPFEIGDSYFTNMRNLNGDKYPAVSVRPARSSYSPNVTVPKALASRNNETLMVVANSSWLSYSTATGAYTSLHSTTIPSCKVVEFNRPSIKENIMFSTINAVVYDGTNTTTIGDANCPKTRWVTAYRDRLYALIDDQIKHSANRASTDWTTADDAGYIQIANKKGQPSGIVTYGDHVLAFTDQSMHELYGSSPTDYSLVDVSLEVGAAEDKSIKECRGVLYFLDYKGVMKYTGGAPAPVGDAVKHYVDNINWAQKTKICAGVLGDKYFLSIPYTTAASDPNLLLEYNSRVGRWYIHDGNYVDFAYIKDELFGLTATGGIHNMETTAYIDPDNTPIQWYGETKPFWDNSVEFRKSLNSIWMVHSVSTAGSSSNALRLSYSTNVDSTAYTQLASSTDTVPSFTVDSTHHNERVLVPLTHLQNCPWYRIKIHGQGLATIFYIQRNVRVRGK